ncbi:MAG: ABC transporter ATP-binding protein [Deltaproteobacteria bacterium HGW-Deltaproteobacteria-15]|jgi:ATP-binding cassette subfamily B protein|nr:MAG: ABC transporter ATP-binding protein [Deltaproteobacteria bacterium HGW-Deltaproteobacteria-15]
MKETFRNLASLKGYFVQNKGALFMGVACLLAVDFLQLLIPLVIKKAVDHLTIRDATPALLLRYAGIIMAIALAMALLRYVWRHFLFGISRKIEEGLRNSILERLLALPASFYQKTKTGDIMARSTNDVNAVRMASGMGLVAVTDAVVLGFAAVGFMIYIDLRLTLISLIPAPFVVYFTRILTRRMSTGYDTVQAVFSDLTEKVRESFSGIRVIKAYSREAWATSVVSREGKRYILENVQLARNIGILFPLMAAFTNLGLAAVIWFGGRLTILGDITTGDLVAFISYLNLLAWPMMATGWVTNLLQKGSASMRRINAVLNEVPQIRDAQRPVAVSALRGRIEFRELSLTYPGHDREAVRDISFEIEKGMTVAFAGHVGSGKTTLLHALTRLYDPQKGSILIDGMEIRTIPLRVLRTGIGFVTQETMIFSDTIRGNVLFGRSGFSDEEVLSALKTVQLFEEVQSLEHGIHTLLGERGVSLSGGQRQRLSLARAVIANPPILVLDDALSMVDTRTEERIMNQILASRSGKTTLIVSNRVSTIGRADLVVVMERGAVVEMGTPGSLMESGREYARLYEKQMLAEELELV